MIYIQISAKEIHLLIQDLTASAEDHGYGLLITHDLQKNMKNKGIDFPHTCRVLEICQPKHAAKVLAEDIRVCLALPCRISVWEEEGQTKVGTLLPSKLLQAFNTSPAMMEAATQVETDMLAIIGDAL